MGLDIYFYRTKKKDALRLMELAAKYDELSDKYCEKYKAELAKIEEKLDEWQSAEFKKQEEYMERGVPYEIDYSKGPFVDLSDLLDPVKERDEYIAVKTEYDSLKKQLGMDIDGDGEFLYMRKMNWMVAYAQARHPEELVYNEEYKCNVIRTRMLPLDRADIEELVSRIDRVLADHALAPELLPTMSRFFFGSTDYDADYFKNLGYAEDHFRKWLVTTDDSDEVLLYEESW